MRVWEQNNYVLPSLLPWFQAWVDLDAASSRGRRLMHEHLFLHLPAWRPPEAVGKQGSCG